MVFVISQRSEVPIFHRDVTKWRNLLKFEDEANSKPSGDFFTTSR